MQLIPEDPINPLKLDKLAEVAVKIGLNLQRGQELLVSAPVTALPLVRLVNKHAYAAGASLVTTIYSDEEATLARFTHAQPESFDRAAGWLYEGMASAFESGAARLAISGDNPMLLAGQDPSKVTRANRAQSLATQPASRIISNFDVNWNIVSYPSASWAAHVFPDQPLGIAIEKLASAIFSASRIEASDPVAVWREHNAMLKGRCLWLNSQAFTAIHFKGPGTDLMVGLADGHEWNGGSAIARNGVEFIPNVPTEEVFTTPHALRVEGYVSSTKPLSHQGTLIDDIQVRFENGRIVAASARRGEDVLHKILETDPGAKHIGEVALVQHSSPISASGILFYNTLFDENASCHIALGQCYSQGFRGGDSLSPEEIACRGGNESLIHVDWMIGSNRVDVDGIRADGSRTPVMRQGDWA